MEMNEENILTLIFLWSVFEEEGRKENETEYKYTISLKVFE